MIAFLCLILFVGVFADDPIEVRPIRKCDTVRCAGVKKCPVGQYIINADPDQDVCCSYCQKYASLGEDCNYDYPRSKLCSNVLSCQSDTNNGPLKCTYSWESNFFPNCKSYGCPTYCSCPDDSYLVKADNVTRCCDICAQKSKLGDYCDSVQPCAGALQCRNSRCRQSLRCAQTQCSPVSSCPKGKYLITRDGDETCCNYCKNYAVEGQYCGDDQLCDEGFSCDYQSQTCVKLKCNKFGCPRIVLFCPDGYILPGDGVKRCCSTCRNYADVGDYCDDEQKCSPGYTCVNNVCT